MGEWEIEFALALFSREGQRREMTLQGVLLVSLPTRHEPLSGSLVPRVVFFPAVSLTVPDIAGTHLRG